MKVFNILKPDILQDKEAIEFYFRCMKERFKINNILLYQINNWISLSKLIYEQDIRSSNLSSIELIEKRKQLLTTIMGYYLYYQNSYAYLSLYNLNEVSYDALTNLSLFKKELRSLYVLNTDKYYLKFLNPERIDFSLALPSIDLEGIATKTLVVPSCEDVTLKGYKMIFFNKIHFPNPCFGDVNRELQIMKENDVLTENNLVRRIEL